MQSSSVQKRYTGGSAARSSRFPTWPSRRPRGASLGSSSSGASKPERVHERQEEGAVLLLAVLDGPPRPRPLRLLRAPDPGLDGHQVRLLARRAAQHGYVGKNRGGRGAEPPL